MKPMKTGEMCRTASPMTAGGDGGGGGGSYGKQRDQETPIALVDWSPSSKRRQ
jgi:hypothetical protein